MANVTVDIASGFYQSDSLPFANQRCVNYYPNFPQAAALKSSSLFEVQGLDEIARTSNLAIDSCRGSWEFQGQPFFVNGNNLFRLTRRVGFRKEISYEIDFIGEVDGGSGNVSMADNGTQLIIINDIGNGFIYEPTASPSFQPIVDGGFIANGVPQKVVYLDRYFIVNTDSKRAIISAVGDGTNWNSIDFISAEADPDGIVAPFIFKNQLYLLGEETTETYQNIGGAGVPFRRINGFVLTQGCSAPNSVQEMGDKVFWIGRGKQEDPVVWVFNGSEPQKVSTTAIDNKIQELTAEQLANIDSWSYSTRGHEFVAFISEQWCLVYDTATGKWHERESEITVNHTNRITKPTRIRHVVSAYNILFCGDSEDGRIGRINANVYKEYSEPLISYFTTSPLYNLSNSFSLPKIEVLCESGVGNSEVPEPEIRLEISRNGVTFENPKTRMLGRIGEYHTRQIWYKSGRASRLCIMRVTISDAVKRRIFGIELKYKQGSNG